MKIKTPLRLFIYFSIFLHLLGGALYYYYKNPNISFSNEKEELPLPEDIAPSVKDSTTKEISTDSSNNKIIKPPSPKVPIKKPSIPPETDIEPVEIKSPPTDSFTEQEKSSDSKISETTKKHLVKKNKNVKIFFGSDNSQSPAEKPNKENPTAPNLSDEAGFAGHEILPSQEETLSSNSEEINIDILPEESISPEMQEETNPELETISLDNEEADPNLEELTIPDTPTESSETEINKSDAEISAEETIPSETQNEEADEDISLNNEESDPLIEELTTSSIPTESLQKETNPETETSPSNNEELDLPPEESIVPDTSTESPKKEQTEGKSSVAFRNFLNLKQRAGNPKLTYPKKARQIKAEGSLSLIFYLTSEGLVEKIQIESSSGHRELDNSVVQTFARYKFTPNQEGWVRHKVDFRLKGEEVEFLRLREK